MKLYIDGKLTAHVRRVVVNGAELSDCGNGDVFAYTDNQFRPANTLNQMVIEELKAKLKYVPDNGVVYVKNPGDLYRYDDLLYHATARGKRKHMKLRWRDLKLDLADVCWLLKTGNWPEWGVSHIDKDRCNNRWSNLKRRRNPDRGEG